MNNFNYTLHDWDGNTKIIGYFEGMRSVDSIQFGKCNEYCFRRKDGKYQTFIVGQAFDKAFDEMEIKINDLLEIGDGYIFRINSSDVN